MQTVVVASAVVLGAVFLGSAAAKLANAKQSLKTRDDLRVTACGRLWAR